MIAKRFTWLRPKQVTPLERRIDWLWAKGMMTGIFLGLAGFSATPMFSLNGPSFPSVVLLSVSGVAIVALTWRSAKTRNQLAGRLALLDADERRLTSGYDNNP